MSVVVSVEIKLKLLPMFIVALDVLSAGVVSGVSFSTLLPSVVSKVVKRISLALSELYFSMKLSYLFFAVSSNSPVFKFNDLYIKPSGACIIFNLFSTFKVFSSRE